MADFELSFQRIAADFFQTLEQPEKDPRKVLTHELFVVIGDSFITRGVLMVHTGLLGDSSAGFRPAATPHPGERPAQKFWRRYFNCYDTLNRSIPYLRMIERNVELLEPSAEDCILDAGTGTGNLALSLAGKCSKVIGIDFCEAALERCRAKLPGGDFRFGDLTRRLEFEDGYFDKVVSCNVIYALNSAGQRNALRELARVLKPGGIAVITVFGERFRALKVYMETIRRQLELSGFLQALKLALQHSVATFRILYYVGRIKHQEKIGAYTFFSRQHLCDLVREAGLEVELIEPIFASQCLVVRTRRQPLPLRSC